MFRPKLAGEVSGVGKDNNHIVGHPGSLLHSKLPVIQVLKDMADEGATELLIGKRQDLSLYVELYKVRHTIGSNIYVGQDLGLTGYYLSLAGAVGAGAKVDYPLTIIKLPGMVKGGSLSHGEMQELAGSISSYSSGYTA